MDSLTFQGRITIKEGSYKLKAEAINDASTAFNRVSTVFDPWLVICHDGSYHRDGRGGAGAVCNWDWLPRSRVTQASQGTHIEYEYLDLEKEILFEESVAFTKITSSLMAEQAACSLACDMALRELRRNSFQLIPGIMVHLVLIGDCTEMWRCIRERRPGVQSFIRDLIAYQSNAIHQYAKSIGIWVDIQGLWCPRTAYEHVRYLGISDRIAGRSSRTGFASCSLNGNQFQRRSMFPTWLDVLDPSILSMARIITDEPTIPTQLHDLLLQAGLAQERTKLAVAIANADSKKRRRATESGDTSERPQKRVRTSKKDAPLAAGTVPEINRNGKRKSSRDAPEKPNKKARTEAKDATLATGTAPGINRIGKRRSSTADKHVESKGESRAPKRRKTENIRKHTPMESTTKSKSNKTKDPDVCSASIGTGGKQDAQWPGWHPAFDRIVSNQGPGPLPSSRTNAASPANPAPPHVPWLGLNRIDFLLAAWGSNMDWDGEYQRTFVCDDIHNEIIEVPCPFAQDCTVGGPRAFINDGVNGFAVEQLRELTVRKGERVDAPSWLRRCQRYAVGMFRGMARAFGLGQR